MSLLTLLPGVFRARANFPWPQPSADQRKRKEIMKTTTQHKIARLLAAASLVALTSPALRAADQSSANSLGQVAQADKVYGNQVLTTDNQKVGHLNNLMIDIESGRILYGVIGAGKE